MSFPAMPTRITRLEVAIAVRPVVFDAGRFEEGTNRAVEGPCAMRCLPLAVPGGADITAATPATRPAERSGARAPQTARADGAQANETDGGTGSW
jgi:hypothetical protein